MNDEINVVEQYPVAFALALAPVGLDLTLLSKLALDLLGDRAYLPVVGSVADDEVVRDDQLFRDVEDDDALGLLGRGRLGCLQCQTAARGLA